MQHRSARIEVRDQGMYSTATLFLDGQQVVIASASDAELARAECLDGWEGEMRRSAALVPDDAMCPW